MKCKQIPIVGVLFLGVNLNSIKSFAQRVERGVVEGAKDVAKGVAGGPRELIAVGTGCVVGAKAAAQTTVYSGNSARKADPGKMLTGCVVGAIGGYEVATLTNSYSFTKGFQRGWNQSAN